MIGAIAGDIIGSIYEFHNVKTVKFPLFTEDSVFTDDTVLTIATADSIINNKNYEQTLQYYGNKFPGRGYGGYFSEWLEQDNPKPYNSFGNGSAMRVSPVGFAFNTLDSVLEEAQKNAEVTHNHIEGIKGAQAVAAAVFLARTGKSKNDIKKYISKNFNYNLNRTVDDIRKNYSFNESCQGSVPEAIIAFLESTDFENAIRLAISLGGDSDTIACITGAISEAFYKEIPAKIIKKTRSRLNEQFLAIIDNFEKNFPLK